MTGYSAHQIANTALSILKLWKIVIDESVRLYPQDINKQIWHQVYMRQAYQDALNAMIANKLITTFNVTVPSVTLPTGEIFK